ncbi:hemagglutinin repeat-containing protein [Brenneria roseae]|uniref:hemagglutinin repeat-containing protein n=1 Tax=Brenneria roseae TaxID=1509241 RepID=UPI001FF792DF|nr:hemagglutinin repeat-containing protein [Brenneria roseae]
MQTQQFTQQGSLIAQDKMTLRIPQWVNQGLIQAQQAEIIADVLENQGTLLGLTQLALQTHRLINQQDGKIYSAQDLILKTDELQQDGQLLALGNLTADISGPLAFSRLLAAGNRLTLNVAGDLDLSGTLQGQSVALASAGKLTNQGNILAGDGDSRITAQDIVQQEAGSIQAGGNLSLVSANDIHNQGLIGVAGDLLMQAGGLLNNTSLLYAAGNMRLFSDSLSNVFGNILAGNNLWLQRDAQGNASSAVLNSSGTIETQSGDITITTGTLTNQREGLVVTETQLDVGQMPSWAGGTTANIPIDWFKAGEVGMFRKETTVKGGGNNGSSESIRYDFIYAPYEKADIQKIIAGSKFVDVHVQGDAARISAGNDLFVNAGELNNQASQIFSVENILLKGGEINNQSYISGGVNEVLIYEYQGQPIKVGFEQRYALYRPSEGLDTSAIYILKRYIPYVLSGTPTYEQTIDESYNALIQAGGTITADFAEDISNTTLQPGSGGFMPGTVTPVLASTQALSPLQKQTTRQLVDNDASLNADTVDLSNTGVDAAALGSNASAVSPAAKNVTLSKVTEPTLQSGVQAEQITAGTAVTLEKPGAIADGASTPVSVEASATSHLSASELMSAIGNGLQALSSNPLADYPLPAGNNGLLVVDPSSDSRYLIHTNPKLEQLGQVDNSLFNELQSMLGQQPATTVKVETSSQWTQTDKVLGSSYLLDKLNLDADHDYRFLGDAEFDTRYISNAVLSQSGKRYLDGTGSDLSQMQMLLDNAATAQKGLNLQLGVSLTPDQVANLSQSIVWWENIEVNGQTVLAPKLYLAQADKNNVQGSAIVANQVSLSAGGSVTNSGTISAVELLAIASGDKIDNQEGGLLKSDGSLNLVALNNITNSGSQIEGNTLQLASINGDIINKTESREWQTSASAASGSGMGYLTFTELGKTAEITAANSLTMTAGHDIRNVAATLSAGQDMTLNAANDVSIEALTLTNDRLDQGRNRSQLSLNTAVQGSQLTADGTLQANAGNNIQIDAGMISGGAGLSLTAANDIQLTAQQTLQETLNHNGGNTAQRRTQEIASTQLLSGGDLELLAGRDVLAEAASLNAKGDATLAAGRDLNLLSEEEESYSGNWWKRHADWQQNITQQSTELTAGEGLILQAGRDINLQAAQGIAGGALTAQAGNDINLLSATETQHTFFEETKVKKKTFSKTVTHTLNETLQTDEKGSLLSGDSVTMAASHDINLQGSSVVGDNQVVLLADNDVNTAASVENYQHYEEYTKKKSGLFSSGGIGFTIGSTSTSQKLQDQAVTQSQSVSTLGSTGQSVTINAGNDVNISGTDMVAGQDITLTGNNVTIDPGYDLRTQQQQFEQKSSGLTVALSGVVGSALNSAVQNIQAAQSESDGRLALLQGMKAGLSGFQAYQASQSDLNDQGSASFVGVSISLGAQTSRSSQTTEQQQSFGSTLNAGHDIAIESRQGDITVTGSQLKAANDVVMNAAQDINLLSSRNSETLSGKNSSSGGNIGVSLGISNGSAGLSIFANVNGSKGRETGVGNSWSETTVDAGSEVKLESQRDTRLIGAQVTGEHIDVQTGRDLLLQSQQDSDRYDSKQVSGSAGGSFTWGSMSGSGYFSVSQDKMHSNYDSVQQQTGFFAGKEGFDIKTGNHTQLDAAVIASTASADKNTLDTGTLGWSGVDNKAEFKVEHSGFGMSASPSMNGNLLSTLAMNVPSALMSLGNNGNASSTTYAAVSDGSLLIRDNANQQQDITTLSRDVEHANNALSPIFNKEKEQKRLKQAQLIGELGAQVMDIVRTEGELRAQKAAEASGESKVSRPDDNAPADEWDAYKKALTETASYKTAMEEYGTGGTYQRAAQAATAAIQALAGGDIQKAIASGASPYLAQMVKDITMPQGESGATASDIAANAMAHAVVGAVVAQLSGQDAAAGAIGAAGGELLARVIMETQYPGKKVEDLTEEEKQSVSALSTLAAGLASGLATGDTASAASGAQAGRNAVENNFLGATSSDKLDKAVEKIKNGDKTLATANELIKLENADKRSDALVDKFTRDPSKMGESEQAELAGYLRVYASEMEKEYGSAVSQELVKGLLSGQDYIKRNPDSEAMSKAQAIMNTWGYHKSNASIGDAPLIFGSSVLGTTIKEGMALNAAIGVGVNTVSQLSGKEPFSYVDAIMAGITSAATTGKGIGSSAAINMAGAAVGSGIKGEDPTNSVIGAGLGSVAGSKAEKYITGGLSTAVKEGTAEVVGAVGGSTASEIVSDAAKNALDKAEHKDEKK